MLTIIFNRHKITGEVKDIYEFIKLAESEVVSGKNDEKLSDTLAKLGYEIEVDEPDILKAKKQSDSFDYKIYFEVDFNKHVVKKYVSDGKIITNDSALLGTEEIILLDELFGKNHWTKIRHDDTDYTTKPIEKMDKETADEIKGRKYFYLDLCCAECNLVYDIKNLKDSDVELVEFAGAYKSEHNEGQWLRFIISYFGGHDRYLEVNYKAKKFVYYKINEGLSVENLRLTAELKDCLLGYEQETIDKWWREISYGI